jgi:hypothetical protein
MTHVTPASIAYIATQVRTNSFPFIPFKHTCQVYLQTRFSLSSSSVFSRTDTSTDSERFYNSVLELFDDIEEREEVEELLVWWNRCALPTHHYCDPTEPGICRQIFPNYISVFRPLAKDSALAKIKEKRARTRAAMGGAVGGYVPTRVL